MNDDNSNGSTSIEQAFTLLDKKTVDFKKLKPVPFKEFLNLLQQNPSILLRNVFQAFHDMIKSNVQIFDTALFDDPEEFDFTAYDCTKLFVEGSEEPYFTDMLFANRFMKQMESLRHGTQQNRIYIFHGPHGCGKSTFLNNLLRKFEQYANTDNGLRYEILWRLDVKKLWRLEKSETITAFENYLSFMEKTEHSKNKRKKEEIAEQYEKDYIEIPCMSHDNPILMIPKESRRDVLDGIIENDEFKWRLFTEKEYEWVFNEEACTICTSIFQSLLERLGNPTEVFNMLYARPYDFNRRLGNGISVFNPGDKPVRRDFYYNEIIQRRINILFQDSNIINYIYSKFAKVNNGIYALMDIKSHNIDRMVELHNIISEGLHKVEDIEEKVNSLFFALMNPEDKKNIKDVPSFSDRIQYINIPYVLDVKTEVNIYRDIFGKHIDESFLPMVLHNFAKIVISTRLNEKSDALLEWIKKPEKYKFYCDKSLMLLKMEIYSGNIPSWIDEDDRKALDVKMWRKIIIESEKEGNNGFSGRDSIKLFDQFYSRYLREDQLINMPELCLFFNGLSDEYKKMIPEEFMSSLIKMYDYCVLQQVKESLYYYNEAQIVKDIKNYISAVNFENDSSIKCVFTHEKLEISEGFFKSIESRLFAGSIDETKSKEFRSDVLKQYTTHSLSQEIMIDGKTIEETKLFLSLYERYAHNLKNRVLEPFIENENFRRAIKDFDTDDFKAYDNRIKTDVKFLINNLVEKFNYTQQGANKICIYVIDNDIAKKF
ncbi:MAG: serine protein kinase PrkA [Desulfobacteraceae bacterium]|nr:serine protein kinase PrkA [Desulfobacteraceae bacterium]